MTKESALIVVYMLEMAMLCIFDFILPHYIQVIFLMCLASNMAVFYLFKYLVEHHEVASSANPDLQRYFTPVKIAVPSIYILCGVLCFVPKLGAFCNPRFTYRK